jgi:hypothetical protein
VLAQVVTKRKPGARPPLIVHAARVVPMTPEQEARAFEVLKALFIGHLREHGSFGARLDNAYPMEPSLVPHKGTEEGP